MKLMKSTAMFLRLVIERDQDQSEEIYNKALGRFRMADCKSFATAMRHGLKLHKLEKGKVFFIPYQEVIQNLLFLKSSLLRMMYFCYQ